MSMSTKVSPSPSLIQQTHELGQSIWYDNISRGLLRSGGLRALVDQGVTGVTSNPTIFEKAIGGTADYEDAIRRLVADHRSAQEIYEELVLDDIRNGCDVLAPQWEASGGVDGRVSIEVDPRLAHETDKTIQQAIELWKIVDRPNLLIVTSISGPAALIMGFYANAGWAARCSFISLAFLWIGFTAYAGYLQERPDDVGAMTNLAVSLSALGRLDQAVSAFRRAVEMNPRDPQLRRNLDLALEEQAHAAKR